MRGVNKVILIGNLGKDPELRYLPSGQAVTKFSLATGSRWKDKEGQWQDRTDWHNIVAFGKTAEICNEYLKKGSQVYIEGRIQTRSYDDRDGNKKWITEIIAQTMQMLGRKGEAEEEIPETAEEPQTGETKSEDDDLPF
ncbi:MAG: single-stranded DNA-binding protein [Candidatus Zixiibacteriota bacterium]